MVYPIWKNYEIVFSDAQFILSDKSVEYTISVDSHGAVVTIFAGKAWTRPGNVYTTININEVCADWLTNTFPSLSEGFSQSDIPVEFVVQALSTYTGAYKEVARVRFINDWSYDNNHVAETDGLAHPINGRIDSRQWLLWTGLDVSLAEAEVTLVDGSVFSVFIPVEISADFSQDFNADFAKSVRSAGSGTAVFSPSQWGKVAKVSVQGVEYHVVDTCSRYVLYYLNAYGGWDTLLIEGATTEQDNLTRSTINKSGAYDRQKANYINNIQKRLSLRTSWLSDEQSLKMHHLLNSTDVYLHDLDKNEILPVVLDGATTPYKTFKGEGGKLVNYTIEATIAQTRMRR